MLDRYDPENPTQRIIRRLLEETPTAAARSREVKALHDIHEGIHTAVSIDAFIHRHREDEDIAYWGKILIALEILNAERKSSLSSDHWNNFAADPNVVLFPDDRKLKNPDYTWIGHFFRILSDGVQNYQDLGKDITIICFNYDRCIEVYLTETIADAYRIPVETALRFVESNFRIIHPYGYLGPMTVVPGGSGKDRLSYGYIVDDLETVKGVAQNIQTYTEQAHDAGKVWSIHEAISECKNLIFLGFGFNNQNLDLLRVKTNFNRNAKPKNVYATCFGLYPQIKETLTRRILDLFLDEPQHGDWLSRVNLEFDVGCAELLRIHDMNFSSFIQRYIRLEQEMRGMVSKVERYSPYNK
ncbi:hypothetical protein FY156_23925 [Agrobacterium tumefaciens]|nr:hypothetical protein FY156_23925 [Agrobacterium tumefaciens]